MEGIWRAAQNAYDVVLIDTSGQIQNNVNFMGQIARLINEAKPDMTVFVARAFIGGIATDQIQLFDETLQHVCRSSGQTVKGIDGIILTNWDRLDDIVGAALTLVYRTRHPILYLGTGPDYQDLKKMNPELVMQHLFSGFKTKF
jgi:signal recognition particle receptor subunit alpha